MLQTHSRHCQGRGKVPVRQWNVSPGWLHKLVAWIPALYNVCRQCFVTHNSHFCGDNHKVVENITEMHPVVLQSNPAGQQDARKCSHVGPMQAPYKMMSSCIPALCWMTLCCFSRAHCFSQERVSLSYRDECKISKLAAFLFRRPAKTFIIGWKI